MTEYAHRKCEICSKWYAPKTHAQRCCASVECTKELKRMNQKRRRSRNTFSCPDCRTTFATEKGKPRVRCEVCAEERERARKLLDGKLRRDRAYYKQYGYEIVRIEK